MFWTLYPPLCPYYHDIPQYEVIARCQCSPCHWYALLSCQLIAAITVANAAPAADQILAAAVADSFAPFPLSKRGNTCPTGLNANGTYDWQKCFQGDTPAACKSVCDNVAPDAKNCPGLYAAMCATVVCAVRDRL